MEMLKLFISSKREETVGKAPHVLRASFVKNLNSIFGETTELNARRLHKKYFFPEHSNSAIRKQIQIFGLIEI